MTAVWERVCDLTAMLPSKDANDVAPQEGKKKKKGKADAPPTC